MNILKAKKILEKQGYCIFNVEKSLINLIAIMPAEIANENNLSMFRAIQINYNKKATKKEIEKLKKLNLPAIVSKEIWYFKKGDTTPIIEEFYGDD